MSYLLQVDDAMAIENYDWFYDFLKISGFFTTSDDIDDILRPWGAKNIKNSVFIEFETKEQAFIFKLRWA
jgi:hypothetical protein